MKLTFTHWNGRRGPLAMLAASLALAALAACAHPVAPGAAPGLDNRAAAAAPAEDPQFARPYIDVDEWRDAPVRHRYIHGGFEGTQTRFSFYFPPNEQYEGRFFQHFTPFPLSENLAQAVPPGSYNKIGFAISSGAYFVETNAGDAPANAAAAQYSRVLALAMYGGSRPYGYAYGGSGGGYRTIGAIESTRGVWDGVVPYVIGSTMAIPNMFTVRVRAMRLLWDEFPRIVDAVEPGGSGDPYAGLNDEQTEALREVTRMGFPTPAWFGYETMGMHGLSALYGGVRAADPTYFTDFWTERGYLGHDRPELFAGARLQFETSVAAPIAADLTQTGGVDTAFRGQGREIVGFRLNAAPPAVRFIGGELVVLSGAAAGETLLLSELDGDTVAIGGDRSVAQRIAVGDRVRIDNSNFLALETYHRHQVPGPDFPVWDQFRNADGQPIYPQRPALIGPMFVQMTAGTQLTGAFEGKMIVAASLWDREAMPWQADWYAQRVRAHLGENTDDNFRLWYTDHALHGDEGVLEDPTRVVSYEGVLQQALRDLSAWVEEGRPPPASTRYAIEDGHVHVRSGARERRGVQPVAHLSIDGRDRADVRVGDSVTFTARLQVPPGAGEIIEVQWDFDGEGRFPVNSTIRPGARQATISVTHRFEAAGTFFPTVRVVSNRGGDRASPYARLYNLDRVRVVVL